MSIQIQVRNKIAVNLTPDKVIVCGNNDYDVEFLFDDEWESERVRTARFVYRKGGQNYFDDVVFHGNTVKAPKLSNINYVLIGVYAGDLRTTTPAVVECEKSILCGSGTHKDPTPDVYIQLVELINTVVKTPVFDLAALGMSALPISGGYEVLETDTTEIVAALDKGSVVFIVPIISDDITINARVIMNGLGAYGTYQCFANVNFNSPFTLMLTIQTGLIHAVYQPMLNTIGIPALTADDYGKILEVVDGEYVLLDVKDSSVAAYVNDYISSALEGDY